MSSESAGTDVAFVARRTRVWTLVGVQSLVQLQMYELSELGWTQLARVRLLTAVQSEMRLQVASAAESLVTHFAFVGLLS